MKKLAKIFKTAAEFESFRIIDRQSQYLVINSM